jgi:hypothetical protein
MFSEKPTLRGGAIAPLEGDKMARYDDFCFR